MNGLFWVQYRHRFIGRQNSCGGFVLNKGEVKWLTSLKTSIKQSLKSTELMRRTQSYLALCNWRQEVSRPAARHGTGLNQEPLMKFILTSSCSLLVLVLGKWEIKMNRRKGICCDIDPCQHLFMQPHTHRYCYCACCQWDLWESATKPNLAVSRNQDLHYLYRIIRTYTLILESSCWRCSRTPYGIVGFHIL